MTSSRYMKWWSCMGHAPSNVAIWPRRASSGTAAAQTRTHPACGCGHFCTHPGHPTTASGCNGGIWPPQAWNQPRCKPTLQDVSGEWEEEPSTKHNAFTSQLITFHGGLYFHSVRISLKIISLIIPPNIRDSISIATELNAGNSHLSPCVCLSTVKQPAQIPA